MQIPLEPATIVEFEDGGVTRIFIINKMGPYTPGQRPFSHYEVKEESTNITPDEPDQFDSWASVERHFTSMGFGEQFKERFPGPEYAKFV